MTKFTTVRSLLSALAKAMNLINPDMENHHQETAYVSVDILDGLTYGQFLSLAPAWNPKAELITGSICGVRVEGIIDPQEKKMRQLDKLIDELAKGKPMEEVLR